MPQVKHIPNRFTSVDLSEEAQLRGSIYTIDQLNVLQNIMSEAALTKNALVLDPNDVLPYMQQEAYQASRIELVEFMLDNHDAAIEALAALMRGTTTTPEG